MKPHGVSLPLGWNQSLLHFQAVLGQSLHVPSEMQSIMDWLGPKEKQKQNEDSHYLYIQKEAFNTMRQLKLFNYFIHAHTQYTQYTHLFLVQVYNILSCHMKNPNFNLKLEKYF